jgi:hypothetical protein
VNVTGLSVKNCKVGSLEGRGGGIYLTTTDGNAELTLFLSFETHVASKGKHIDVICGDIVNVVKNKFSFMTNLITEGLREDFFWGKQKEITFITELDLFTFFTRYHSSPFFPLSIII